MNYKLEIPSNLSQLEPVAIWAANCLPDDLDETDRRHILLLVQELTTNSILHGNKEVESKKVLLQLDVSQGSTILTVRDEGDGLPSMPSKEEAQEMDYLDVNGRGLKLVALLSDKVEVNESEIKVYFNR